MSRWSEPARGTAGKVTPEDFAVWRGLVSAAQAAAIGEAARPVPGLAKIGKTARNTAAPGIVSLENPCIRLSKLVGRYVGETAAGRRRLQGELAEKAEAAAEYLDAEERPVGAERKDVHG